jgi:chromate transporter
VTAPAWLALFAKCLALSLLAVGGALTVAPEMHRLLVLQMGILSEQQFSAAIAVAQASPGPNALYVAVLGLQAAGISGAAVMLAGFMLPSSALALLVGRWQDARHDLPVLQAFKAGMAPVTIALLVATSWILTVQVPGWRHVALAIATALLVWRTRVHLLLLLAAGAILGVLGAV